MDGKEGKNMAGYNKNNDLESQKIELIKLRIKNGFYDRDFVLNRVVEGLINDPLAPLKKK
ncbi:MAG: hypothetical protein GF313_16235 [Caldithrix sp.]|nr:hypothetical protein [Caldithrix sp.]